MIILILSILILIISLFGLIWSSQFLIRVVEKYIEMTGKSETIVGFIILSIISSTPEFSVALFSIIESEPGFSIGDIFGSHLFNIGIVIGILALLGYFKECDDKILIEIVDILFLAAIIPIFLLITEFRQIMGIGALIIGLILISIYFFTIYHIYHKKVFGNIEQIKKDSIKEEEKIISNNSYSKKKIISMIIIGGVVIFISGRFLISSAIIISNTLGIFPITFGAKIIAIGTSLPELLICYRAVKKGRIRLALSDILGANLTTTTLVFGMVLIFSPFTFNLFVFTELILFIILINIILLRYLIKGGISQAGGFILIMIYILFQAIVSIE